MIGTQLAERYRVLDEIGSGAMGVVYRALDEKLNCPVAIKVLKPAAPGDESLRKQALEEARHIAKLNHPNVVTVHDVESKQGRDFLVMEYVPGVTLDQMLSGGPLPETEVVELGTQLLEGLRAAHVQGLIHRDLKPGNLRVTPDGRLKILDFGLAKGLQSSSGVGDSGTLTASLVVKGTLPYMAPEQLLGKKVDQRVDIYAAGAVLYEMATGQRLYPEFSGGSLQHAILNNTPERPRAVNPEISARLEGVILKALEKQPEQRYPTAAALLSALKALREAPVPPPPRPLAWTLAAVILAVAALLAAVFVVPRIWRPPPPRRAMLAVLPFVNLSADKEQIYFTDGMTEEMITQLGRLDPPRLGVIARTSVMKFRDTKRSIRQIGKELGVHYILEGSVRREGQRVRVTAQLNRVSDQTHQWADDYDAELADVFAVQTKIAKGIAQTLMPKLLEAGGLAIARPPTQSAAAHEAYLKGRYYLNRRTEEGLGKAIQYLAQAAALDPGYAVAHAGLADAYLLLSSYGLRPPPEVVPQAKAEAREALRLDESLAEGHTSLASILQDYDWDWPGAEREFKRAIELDPSYSTAHQWYADYLVAMGRMDDALKEIQQARELDPLSPIISADLGTWYFYARRYDDAVDQYRKTIELDENFAAVYTPLGLALWQQGRHPEAVEAFEKAAALAGASPEDVAALRQATEASGPAGVWRWRLDVLTRMAHESYVSPFDFAVAYALLGQRDQAFEWLDRAYHERSPQLVELRMDALLDSLRSDPRFDRLLHRIGLSS